MSSISVRGSPQAGAASMTFWWSVVRALSIAFALLPVVVLGAGVTALGPPTAGAAALLLLLSIGVALGCASRPWADTKQTPAS